VVMKNNISDKNFCFSRKSQSGVAVLFVVLILSVVLVIGLGVSSIMINQIKMSADVAKSMQAFYAADAGAEECLYQAQEGSGPCAAVNGIIPETVLDNNASYTAKREAEKSISTGGKAGTTFRKIEVSWE